MAAHRHDKSTSQCPCTSGQPYGRCCQPLHRGEREADEPAAVVRSRYAAFALGEIDYLIRTLHPDHVDAGVPRETLLATLRAASRSYKYTGLTILESRSEGDQATVVFRARVFDKGRDLSFVEASTFVRSGGAWRYLSGDTVEDRS
jgi:SEC-C motif-containing protein